MSKLRNIGGTQGDKFHRYKMPEIQSKIEKPNTNGQQTIVLNVKEIATALKCDPEYPTRFWGFELGAGAKYQDNSDRTCAIIKGMFYADDLTPVLDKFITMYILCPNCKLPETRLSVKQKSLHSRCASCGFNQPIDHGHRLDNFIIKKKEEDKSGKKKKKGKKNKGEEEEVESKEAAPAGEDHSLFAKSERDEVAAASKKKKEKKEETVSFATDVSAQAQALRRQQMMEAEFPQEKKRVKVGKVDTSKPEQILRAFILEKDRDVHEVLSEISRLVMGHEMSLQEKWRVTFEGLLDSQKPKTLSKQIKKQAAIFKALADSPTSQLCIITSSVRFLQAGEMERLPIMLRTFYDQDILVDDCITSWYNSPPETDGDAVGQEAAQNARQCAEVFVKWLEEDSDDESSGDD